MANSDQLQSSNLTLTQDGRTIDRDAQYGRICSLVVFDSNLNGLDLSELRIKFSAKSSNTPTPNMADIKVYNLSEETALQIKKEFKRVILQAGYEGNYGVIFQGNIKQVIIGRESGQDTFINIIAGDGDRAYNHAIVRTTLASGSTIQDQITATLQPMSEKGVTAGNLGVKSTVKLPRAKVMYGAAKEYLSDIAATTDQQWAIQDEKINFTPTKTYLPGEIVLVTDETGMIGAPQQTNEGVNVKMLLNPRIIPGGRIHLDNENIQLQKLNLEQIALAKGDVQAINNLFPPRLNSNGYYYNLVLEHTGDTRGIEWYTSVVCLNIDVSANPLNSIQGQ